MAWGTPVNSVLQRKLSKLKPKKTLNAIRILFCLSNFCFIGKIYLFGVLWSLGTCKSEAFIHWTPRNCATGLISASGKQISVWYNTLYLYAPRSWLLAWLILCIGNRRSNKKLSRHLFMSDPVTVLCVLLLSTSHLLLSAYLLFAHCFTEFHFLYINLLIFLYVVLNL